MINHSALDWGLFLAMVAVLFGLGLYAAYRQDRAARARVTPIRVPRASDYPARGQHARFCTVYPTDSEEADGIGPWIVEPCERAHPIAPTNGLSEFELDRVARVNARIARLNAHYAELHQLGGDNAHAAVNGSIGGTTVPAPGYVVDWDVVGYGALGG